MRVLQRPGCRVCKTDRAGWKLLGCGMIHSQIAWRRAGIDSERWQGYCLRRWDHLLAMLAMAWDDLRLFFENDLQFLKQFPLKVTYSWLRGVHARSPFP